MKRIAFSTAFIIAAACLIVDGGRGSGRVSAAVAGEHDYFDSLVRRADAWKSYSLRSTAQLASRQLGGNALGPANAVQWVTYSPGTDTDRHRQDAAKVVVPAFYPTTTLSRDASASDTVLTLVEAYKALYPLGRVIRVDHEVMVVTAWLSATTISVQRGAYQSPAAPHASGATLMYSTNNLPNMVTLPLGTEDGHSYFFTWDGYWTDSYVGAGAFNHKAFQFSSGGRDGDTIFLEPDTTFSGNKVGCWNQSRHVANVSVRSYNKPGGVANWLLTDGDTLGPGATATAPLGPRAEFCYEPNQWVRFFVNLRQRANDYDYVDMWMADETQDPVQILFNVPISVRPSGGTPNSIQRFWLEFNTSSDNYFRIDNRDLVAYVRNFVALRDTADVRPLLIRPVPGAEASAAPGAPRNVRIIQGS